MSEQPIGASTQPSGTPPSTPPPPSRGGGGVGKGLLLGLGGGCGCLTLLGIVLLLLIFLLVLLGSGGSKQATPTPASPPRPTAVAAATPGTSTGGQSGSQQGQQGQPGNQGGSQGSGSTSGQTGTSSQQPRSLCDVSQPQGDADIQVCLALGRVQNGKAVGLFPGNTLTSAETSQAGLLIQVRQARATVSVGVGLFRRGGEKPELIGEPVTGQLGPQDQDTLIVLPIGGQLPVGEYIFGLFREQPDGTMRLIAALPFTVR
ncbi:hypothetical protein [Thermorudis peleae]|uniref:hypothetical protein n=1 Tax=Thermorudis peleae TaxID=1382356 RepID=UPI00056FE7B3|nr:hypothetical protein [Thermorudis peleae]